MDTNVLKAEPRDIIGKKVKLLRKDGKLPGIIYGKGKKPIPITLELREASKLLRGVSSSTLLTIEVDGKEHTTLVRERQRDFIRGNYLHIDFLEISLKDKVKAKVNFVFEGIAPAIEAYEGLLITGLDQVEVESLPADLPEKIVIDLTVLENMGDGIFVRDLEFPENVVVIGNLDEMVAVITSQAIVEEEEDEEVDEELLEGEVEGEAAEGEEQEDEPESPEE